MNPLYLVFLLLVVALAGCDSREDFLDYDNDKDVTGFREIQNEKVLAKLEEKKEELTRQLAEPGEEGRDKLEEDLANTNRRLGYPEFFTYDATMEDLPGGDLQHVFLRPFLSSHHSPYRQECE